MESKLEKNPCLVGKLQENIGMEPGELGMKSKEHRVRVGEKSDEGVET